MVHTRVRKGSTKSAKGENEQSDRTENSKRGKHNRSSESNLNTSSLIMGTESASTSSSDSEDSEKLLNNEYKKKNLSQKSSSQQNNESSGDSDTSSHTSASSDDGQPSHTHQTGHQISDSDSEIHEIAKSHSNDIVDDMSDFSIASPRKPKGTPSQKDLLNSFLENSPRSPKKGRNIVRAKSDDSDQEMPKTSNRTASKRMSVSSPMKGKSKKSGLSNTKSNVVMEMDNVGEIPPSPHKRKDKLMSPSKSVGKQPLVDEGITEQHLKLRYKTPDGFEPTKLTVSNKDLCKEDLDGKELWLIKAPIDFDIQQLSDVEIDLNGTSDFQTNNGFYDVIGTADKSQEMALFNSVLPSKEKGSFTVGPKFKGQIHVMQSIEIPSLPPIQRPEPVIHEIPVGLKPRFEPFGSGSPIIMRKRKHHHHHHHHHHQSDLPGSQSVHKRKHRLDQDDTENGEVEVKKMKKQKKKKIKKEHD